MNFIVSDELKATFPCPGTQKSKAVMKRNLPLGRAAITKNEEETKPPWR